MFLLELLLQVVILVLPVHSASTPTVSPTAIPTSIVEVETEAIPIAFHQLVVVDTAGSTLIRLKSYDIDSFKLIYKVGALPESGTLYQLSSVFSLYGYEPKAGEVFSNSGSNTIVTGSNNRVFYQRPSPDAAGLDKWGTFEYVVVSEAGITSYPGTVTLVPTSGSIVGSGFLLSNEAWTIEGNKLSSYDAQHEAYSRGSLLNHYVLGIDDKINVPVSGGVDQSLWYFVAPEKFLGNMGIAYGGSLQFTIGSFSGDFSALNSAEAAVVILECAECEGPVGAGITLHYTMNSLAKSPHGAFTGASRRVSIPLVEGNTGGWLKDPQNSLQSWSAPSKCDLIQVLSRLSKVKILGDWTRWYETVALDDVQLINMKGRLPVCAMVRPDASICNC